MFMLQYGSLQIRIVLLKFQVVSAIELGISSNITNHSASDRLSTYLNFPNTRLFGSIFFIFSNNCLGVSHPIGL